MLSTQKQNESRIVVKIGQSYRRGENARPGSVPTWANPAVFLTPCLPFLFRTPLGGALTVDITSERSPLRDVENKTKDPETEKDKKKFAGCGDHKTL
jgi:hypothetical protein